MTLPILSPIAAGCTVAIAPEIAAQRARHAVERLDFHTHFPHEAPHELWTLLLLVAFEPERVERRRALSAAPDVALDCLVVETFLATVESLPYAAGADGLRAHVLRTWSRKLRKAPHAAVSAPPPMFQPIRRARPMCLRCQRRPALTHIRGEHRVVKNHDLCGQCWRSVVDSTRTHETRSARRAPRIARWEKSTPTFQVRPRRAT